MSKNQKDELRDLISKYLDRTCTEQERAALVDSIKSSSSPEEVEELWQEAWSETGNEERYEELTWQDLLKLDAKNKGNGTKVISHHIWRWAAAAAVVIGITFMVKWWSKSDDFMIFETGNGENIEFVLDDGTHINLNANSRLVWNNRWEQEGIRSVTLEGEAYFDVAHINLETSGGKSNGDEVPLALPFEVTTSDLTIRVLGTSFNAIQRRGKTEVFLEEGKVELALHGKTKNNIRNTGEAHGKKDETKPIKNTVIESDPESRIVQMVPGEWVSYSSVQDELIQKTIDKIEPLTEWKDGTLSYQDVEFRFMLQNLEDIYGKTFKVNDSTLLERRVKIGVPYEDWETVKDMMGWMLDIEVVELENNQIRIEKRKEN